MNFTQTFAEEKLKMLTYSASTNIRQSTGDEGYDGAV